MGGLYRGLTCARTGDTNPRARMYSQGGPRCNHRGSEDNIPCWAAVWIGCGARSLVSDSGRHGDPGAYLYGYTRSVVRRGSSTPTGQQATQTRPITELEEYFVDPRLIR